MFTKNKDSDSEKWYERLIDFLDYYSSELFILVYLILSFLMIILLILTIMFIIKKLLL